MGTSQQQPCEIWITIEKNPQHIEKDVFDFVKEREVQSSNRASFPSSLSLHPTSNLLQYSVLQDPSRELFTLNLQGPHEVLLQLSTRQDRPPIWKYLSENDVVELQEGDNIKLGRVQLYLKELRFIQNKPNRSKLKKQPQQLLSIRPSRPKECSNRSISDSPLRNSGNFGKNSGIFRKHHFSRVRDSEFGSLKKSMGQSGISGISVNERSCRICFDGCQSRDNPLFNVCLCQGSVKYVHFECLRSWFRSKTVKYQTPHCLYYCYQPLQCEICKYAISNQVSHEGINYSLYQYQQIHPPFAKLEHFAEGKVYEILIRLEEPLDISVGRGAENDVNLNESSVSRGHCMLEYSSQRLFLRALNSRYGSFIELGGNLELSQEPAGLSVSNHMVWLMRKAKPGGIMQCCETEGKAMLVIR